MSASHSQMPQASLAKHLNSKRVLVAVCLVILAIITIRFYHMSVTGFMLSDESYYYDAIVLDHEMFQNRELFSAIYMLFFGGVNNMFSLAVVGAIYASVWGIGSAFLIYLVARRLGTTDQQVSLLLGSMLLLPVFIIMLPTFTTETMALFFALIGIFFASRFHQCGRWTDALVSSLAFVAAFRTREPYLVFGLANLLGVLISNKRSVRSFLAFLIPLVLVFPVGVSFWPVQFAQPLYAYLLHPWFATPSSSSLPSSGPLPPPDTPSLLYAFAIGLLFGYDPILGVLVVISLFLAVGSVWRKRTAANGLPTLNALAGLAAYAGALTYLVYPASGLIPIWTSAAVRATHASLPTVFTLNHAYSKIGTKKIIAVLLILVIAGATQLPIMSQAIQSNLTRTGAAIDRLNLDYRAPYHRLCELAKESGKTIVFALNLRGARVCLSMLPNAVATRVPANQSTFDALLAEGWNTIYLYDDYFTVVDPSSLQMYPEYYRDILISQSYAGYAIETLWVDGESYAFKMTPVATTQT